MKFNTSRGFQLIVAGVVIVALFYAFFAGMYEWLSGAIFVFCAYSLISFARPGEEQEKRKNDENSTQS